MDRELTRRIEDYRRNEAGPLENNLIDELLAGEMDRTEFLRRGAMFGLSVGAIGGLLAFAGEAGAATDGEDAVRQRQGGRHDPRRHRRASAALARAVPAQRGRGARVRRHPRRVPDLHEPAGSARPVARDQLEAERRRDRLDVPDPEGRQVPQRSGADRQGRRREHEAVRRQQGLERRPEPLLRRRRASRRRATTRSSSGSSRRSASSRTCSARRRIRRSSSLPRSPRIPGRGSRAG